MTRSARAPRTARKSGRVWRFALVVIGVMVVGGLLARWSPVAAGLAILAVLAIAIFVIIKPLPVSGLRSRKSGFAALGVAALLITGTGVAGASTAAPDSPVAPAALAQPVSSSAPKADKPKPVPTTFDTETESVSVPFERTTVDDPQRDAGTTAIVTAGVNGVKEITYRVTLVDGVEVSREVVREAVTVAPVNEVTAVGSRVAAPAPAPVPLVQQQPAGGCDPNYSVACVPVASDVDCAGGSGDGPAYVQGPVHIVGTDIYDLDRDGDGIACDK